MKIQVPQNIAPNSPEHFQLMKDIHKYLSSFGCKDQPDRALLYALGYSLGNNSVFPRQYYNLEILIRYAKGLNGIVDTNEKKLHDKGRMRGVTGNVALAHS